MATIEDLLISLKIDPASLRTFAQQVDKAKDHVESDPLLLQVKSDLDKLIASLKTPLENLKNDAEETGKALARGFDRAANAAAELRGSLLAVGAVGLATLGIGLAKATEESRNLARANVILKLTSEDLSDAQKDLRAVANETGFSFSELSASLFDVASAGIQGQAAVDVVTIAARAAAPAGIDVATAFNAIATAMNNFGFSAEEAGDKLVAIADITRGTLGDVSEALGILGPIATSFGVAFNEIGAAFALITNKGVNAARATTSLQAVIRTFIRPAGDAEKAFKRLGIATGDAAFKTQSVTDKLKILTEASRQGRVQLGKMFDTEALLGISVLAQGIGEIEENIVKLEGATGRVDEALGTFLESSGPQIDQLINALGNLITIIGAQLLNAVAPTLETLTKFLIQNQELVTVIAGVGIAFAALIGVLTTFGFILTQLRAVYTIINASITVSTIALSQNTAAVATNAAATASGGRALIALGKILIATRAFLLQSTGAFFAEAAAKTSSAVASVRSALSNEALGASANRLGLQLTTLHTTLATTNVNMNLFTASVVRARIAINSLAGPLGVTISKVSLLGTTLGVAGSAIAGFQLGSFINEWLGLENAVDRVTKRLAGGGGRLGVKDALKAAFSEGLTFFVAPFNKALIAADVAVTRFNNNLRETRQIKFLEKVPGALERFNKLQQQGFTIAQSFAAALNEQSELFLLLEERERKARQGRELTQEQLTRLNVLTQQFSTTQREQVDALKESRAELVKSGSALKVLEDTEKEFQKIVKLVSKDIIETRRGQAVSSVNQLEAASRKRLEILRQRAAAERQTEVDLQNELSRIQIEVGRGRATEVDLRRVESALRDSQERIKQINDLGLQEQENFNRRSSELLNQRIEELERAAAKELSVETQRIDKLIQESQRRLKEERSIIGKLNRERATGNEAAERQLEQLRLEEIRRQDPLRANLVTRAQELVKILESTQAEDLRARLLKKSSDELQRIAGNSEREKRLREEIRDITLRMVDAGDDVARVQQLRAEREEKISATSQEILNRRLRLQQVEKLLFALQVAAQTGADKQEQTESDIEAAEENITILEKERNRLANERIQIELRVTQELRNQVVEVDKLKKGFQGVVGEARKLIELIQQGASEEALKKQREQLQRAVQEQQADISDVSLQEAGMRAAEAEVSLARSVDLIAPAVDQLAQTAITADATLQPIGEQLNDAVSAQSDLTDAIGTFGEEVASRFESFESTFTAQRNILNEMISRIRKTEEPVLREQDFEAAGLAT